MPKQWKHFGDECPRCGNEAEVYTSAKEEGYAYDGDEAICVECGLSGAIDAGDEDDDGNCMARVDWNDVEELDL